MYPRKLFAQEIELLAWLLPENIPAYNPYNSFMNTSQVIGEGRWGVGNLLLDKKLSSIDFTLGMPPVVAYGECALDESLLSISVHEINIDDQLEVQFSGIFPVPEKLNIKDKWCYSYWKSSDPCPASGGNVKEIPFKNGAGQIIYILAISVKKKVLWLHHSKSGFNQLIPITGFYDELLRVKKIRDSALISKPSTFFERIEEFSDIEYILALLEYNKNASRKFNPSDIVIETATKKKNLFQKLFGR